MTALASSLLAALPGGLVPTVGAGVAAPTAGGVFEGLLAGMMAGQGEGGALQPGLPTAYPQTKAQAILAANDPDPLDGAVHLDGPPAASLLVQRADALAGMTDIALPGRASTASAPVAPNAAALPLTAPKAERQAPAPVSSAGPTPTSSLTHLDPTAPVLPPASERAEAAIAPTGRVKSLSRKTVVAQPFPTPKMTASSAPVVDAAIPAARLPVAMAVEATTPAEVDGADSAATAARIDATPAFDAGLAQFAAAGLTTPARALQTPVADGEAPTADAGPRRDRVASFEALRTAPATGAAAPLAPTAVAAPATLAGPTADLAESVAPRTVRSLAPQPGTATAPASTFARAATPAAPPTPDLSTAPTAPTASPAAPVIPTAAVPVAAAAAPTVAAALAAPVAQAATSAPELAAPVMTPTAARAAPTPEPEARRATPARTDRRQAAAAAPAAAGSPAPAPKGPVAPVGLTVAGLADSAADAAAIPVAVAETPETLEPVQPAAPAEVRPAALHTIATADQAAPRGAPETVARLAADIVRKLEGQSTRFDLALDPHGLGRVDVSVEIDRDGKLTASLSFDSAQTAADLRGRSGELRLALEKAGFEVSDSGLSFDMSGQGAGFGQREAGEQNRAWNGRAFQRAQAGAEEADASLAATITNPARRTSSGVDIRI